LLAWHYTRTNAFQQILETGLLKSSHLLIMEEMKQRSDWPELKARIRHNPEAALPAHLTCEWGLFRQKPVVWFSRNQFWEEQAGIFDKATTDGDIVQYKFSMMEYHERGNGLVRLGMQEEKLLDWHRLMIAAKFPLLAQIGLSLNDVQKQNRYDEKNVLGYVGASLPLRKIDRVDMFLPTPDSVLRDWQALPEDRRPEQPPLGDWIPFMFPNSPNPEAAQAMHTEVVTSIMRRREAVAGEIERLKSTQIQC
jgi:hypothetical protein